MKISEKIAILRKRFGYSQEDLANELDISRQSIYKWETDNSTPDLDNIKKMANLFNVSFDKLLDDNIDITVEETVVKKEYISTKKKEYRNVFATNNKLSYNQAEIDHGYPESRKRKNPDSEIIYNDNISKMKKDLSDYGAESFIPLQNDLAGCFFQNTKNKTFGFYFNGSIQFVCPYENYIGSNISNSENEMTYDRQLMLGAGFGRGGLNSIGVGSMPRPVLNKPSSYYLNIQYFDKEGETKEYKLSLNCMRTYAILEYNNVNEAKAFNDITSDFTNRKLNDIYSKLNSLPAIAEKIYSDEISVDELDVNMLTSKYKQTVKKQNEYVKSISEQADTENKQRVKRNWIIVGVLAGIIAIILAISGISNAIEQHKLDVKDQQTAHAVVLMIDDIGEVTLEDKTLLNNIEVSYGKLTDKQKKYVSNYSVYLTAKNQYNVLYKAYMEEYTADDPTRNITLADLKGTWDTSNYTIYIADFANGSSVWYRTYNKQTGSYGIGGGIASNLPSSTIGEYDCLTQTKSGKLYCWNNGIMSEWVDYTIKINSNGDYVMTLKGWTFTKL